jgi:hypothetical protein
MQDRSYRERVYLKPGPIYLYDNLVLAMSYANIVVRVEDIVHDPKGSALCLQPWPRYGIVIANTTLLLLLCWLLYVDKIYWELLQ